MSSGRWYFALAGTQGNVQPTGPVAKSVSKEDKRQHPVKRRHSDEDDSNDQFPRKKHCPDNKSSKRQSPVTETKSTSPWEKLDAQLSSEAFKATDNDCGPHPYPYVFVSCHAPRTHHASQRAPWMAMLELWPRNPEKQLLQRMPWAERLHHASSDTIQHARVPGRPHLVYARTIKCEDPTMSIGDWRAQIRVWHSKLTWLANLNDEDITAFIKPSTTIGTHAIYQASEDIQRHCHFHVGSPNLSVAFNPSCSPDYHDPELEQIIRDGFLIQLGGPENGGAGTENTPA